VGRQQTFAIPGNKRAANPRFANGEVAEIFDEEKGRVIANPEHGQFEAVVLHGIPARSAENREKIKAHVHRAGDESVDVTGKEGVGMFVIAAKHALLRMRKEEGCERLEIPRCRTLTDENFHFEIDFFQSFL